MSALPIVRYERHDVSRRLADLGLSPTVLAESVLAGELARRACGENLPRCYPGSSAWAHTVEALRDRLLSSGCTKSDAGNYPLTVSPDQSFAIGVATGNELTGHYLGAPKTKFPKGPATVEKIEHNGNFNIWGEPVLVKRLVPEGSMLTWLLLIARAIDGVRSELSRPSGIGEDGRVDRWDERIILPTIDPLDGGRLQLPEPGPDIDFDITRRIG